MTETDRHDRRLLHAALIVSSAFLMATEREFLPWPVLALILCAPIAAVAYEERTEGRKPLADWAGVLLGGLIGVIGGSWAVAQAVGSRFLPISVALIPPVAALIPLLTAVKLVRRQLPRDFWVLHGLGMVQTALGCVLGAEEVMVAPLALHAMLGLASLRSRLSGGAWPGFRTILAEGTLLGAAAVVAYFILPGADVPLWNPGSTFGASRMATGYGTEIDLNHQGRLELDDEVAIEFDANDQQGRPTTVPADQRFRAVDLEIYRAGRWRGSTSTTGGRGVPMALPPLPTMTSRQNLLSFRVVSQEITTPVIADPPLFLPVPSPGRRGLVRRQLAYQQIVAAGAPRERTPLQDDVDNRFRLEDLLSSPEAMRPWGWELLESLADGAEGPSRHAEGSLPLKALRDTPGRPGSMPPAMFEASARRLCRFFAESGQYEYTLDLERSDLSLDPVVDFLKNTRRGHCERFASGLALTLRSVGIPARLVKGFRGCDANEEGKYVIRNHHAHSWVEALVPRYEMGGAQQRVSWDWLLLDPTPAAASVTEVKAPEGWLGAVGGWISQQQPLVAEFRTWWTDTGFGGIPNGAWPALACAAGAGALALSRSARARTARAGREIVPRLRALAALEGIRPKASTTPVELARELAARWTADPVLAKRASDAEWLAEEHYRWSFSGAEPDAEAARALFSRLGDLEAVARESSRRRRRRVR